MTPPNDPHNPLKQRRQHRLRHAYQTLHHIIDKLTHHFQDTSLQTHHQAF